jgi:hypothetical protein
MGNDTDSPINTLIEGLACPEDMRHGDLEW